MKLVKIIKPENLHVAIVMDGNGRWANERALERLKGHAKAAANSHSMYCVPRSIDRTQTSD